jgi:hypothetical protein
MMGRSVPANSEWVAAIVPNTPPQSKLATKGAFGWEP